MKKTVILSLLLIFIVSTAQARVRKRIDTFPDGTPIPAWFADTTRVDPQTLGRRFVITDYGARQNITDVQTKAIQSCIDAAHAAGGGVVVVPRGTFYSGSLFFKPGTHLLLEEGAMVKGSERIADFEIRTTRIEGETCKYFCALINADGVDGFTISGPGTIDGNGLHYWEEFWIRRQWNRQCTNKDAQRPRLVYISNSKNVTIQDVRLQNSPFWTNHVYNSSHVRFLNCYIYAPTTGVKAPSSDAIDLDVCHDILIHGCYMSVNDDAVAIKGGKGTYADKDSTNGPNSNIIIENCHFEGVHGCLTLGSESLYDKNIVLRNCRATQANRVLWLKMRPDTPQHYEYVTVENFTGTTKSFLVVRPWTQFFKPQERPDMPTSQCNNIVMKNIKMDCDNFFDVGTSDKYILKDFTFENVNVSDNKNAFKRDMIENTIVKKLIINNIEQ